METKFVNRKKIKIKQKRVKILRTFALRGALSIENL